MTPAQGFGAYRVSDKVTPKLLVGPFVIVFSRTTADGDLYWIEHENGEGLETTEERLCQAMEAGHDPFPGFLRTIDVKKLRRFFEEEL